MRKRMCPPTRTETRLPPPSPRRQVRHHRDLPRLVRLMTDALRKSPEEIGAIGVRHRLLFLHRHRPPGPILEVSPLLPLEVEIETTTKTGLELT